MCSAEMLEAVDGLDSIVAPIGGGGMISGTCPDRQQCGAKYRSIAAEPLQADDAAGHFGRVIITDGLGHCR